MIKEGFFESCTEGAYSSYILVISFDTVDKYSKKYAKFDVYNKSIISSLTKLTPGDLISVTFSIDGKMLNKGVMNILTAHQVELKQRALQNNNLRSMPLTSPAYNTNTNYQPRPPKPTPF